MSRSVSTLKQRRSECERVKTKRTALPDPRKLGCAHEVRPGKPGVCVGGVV